jgi:hypothetical protein
MGLPDGDRQSVEALQWLAYIGRTRNNVTHAGNGREVHLSRVPNAKLEGYCAETNEIFEYLGCFWHGCLPVCPIGTRPLATLLKHCRASIKKQWRGCKKSEMLVIMLFRSRVRVLKTTALNSRLRKRT